MNKLQTFKFTQKNVQRNYISKGPYQKDVIENQQKKLSFLDQINWQNIIILSLTIAISYKNVNSHI